ncbi:MAG: glycosyltransferase [Firmicutes bacterium]|nr:glycosyltransferase [Bacillota bacterium]
MKKLLLMVPMLHQGGFERVCVQTARLLQGTFDVTILIFSDKDINYDVTGLHVINIDVPSVPGKAGKLRNVLKRIRRVRALKKQNRYDISYSFGASANLINVFTRTTGKVVTGLRCQTDLEEPRQVRLFCRRSDRVLSCSKEIVDELERDFGYTRSTYIYNPLAVEEINKRAEEEIGDFPFPRGDEDLKVICSLGRDDRIKGFWHLVKAFSIVHEKLPQARLLILGAGRFDGCRELAEKLGIADVTAFPGVRKNPFPYAAQCDLFLLPSNREGFPNALLEGMALGRPVIAADCETGPREILLSDEQYRQLMRGELPAEEEGAGRNGARAGASSESRRSVKGIVRGAYGMLVPDLDDHEDYDASSITEDDRILAKAMLQMLEDEELQRHYSGAAKARALTYTPDRYRQALTDTLTDILEN